MNSENIVQSQLEREARPEVSPFFAARVTARATEQRTRRWMSAYWLAAFGALLLLLGWAELPADGWKLLGVLCAAAGLAIATADAGALRRLSRIFLAAVCVAALPGMAQHSMPAKPAKGYRVLFNGKNLEGWEPRGDGKWTVLSDGTLVGQRVWNRMFLSPGKSPFQDDRAYRAWLDNQAWLYTKADFGDFDLHVEFWTKTEGNSGISIRDTSRAEFGIAKPADFSRTPSKIGYEIQINNQYPDPTPTGSVYTFNKAPKEAMKEDDWNTFDIEARKGMIRVKLNGKLVSDVPADPKRPVRGPIGLQLHDQFSIVQFRNIWIKE